MKTLVLTFIIFSFQNIKCITQFCTGGDTRTYDSKLAPSLLYGIKDGWYEAIVGYSNYNTGTNSNYKLNVKVEYNSVTIIDFGNGGSVHSGINNEGYLYTGGYLSFEKDSEGNIIVATTNVSVSDNNGMRYFKIRIE